MKRKKTKSLVDMVVYKFGRKWQEANWMFGSFATSCINV